MHGLIGQTGNFLGHNNMYAYCGNNSVMRVDPSGYSWLLAVAVYLSFTMW